MLLYLPLKFFLRLAQCQCGFLYGIPQFWVVLLTAGVGIGNRPSFVAGSNFPNGDEPAPINSGPPDPLGSCRSALWLEPGRYDDDPAAWSFDTMKRFQHETLEPEERIKGNFSSGSINCQSGSERLEK